MKLLVNGYVVRRRIALGYLLLEIRSPVEHVVAVLSDVPGDDLGIGKNLVPELLRLPAKRQVFAKLAELRIHHVVEELEPPTVCFFPVAAGRDRTLEFGEAHFGFAVPVGVDLVATG